MGVRGPALSARRNILAAFAALAALAPATAHGASYAPGEVVVREAGEPARVLQVSDVDRAVRTLRRDDDVAYVAPNPIARAAGFIPNDPGLAGRPGGWVDTQWNLLPGAGVNAPDAWQHLIAAGAPGGRGVVVAVLDTGVAYADRGQFRRSPDFGSTRFVQGHDFVARDPHPNDENGHGTHVASTIAESTDNGTGLTGLAYGASIMPLRVLDRNGEGDAATIADAVRYAVRNGADVINLSLEFGTDVRAKEIPSLLEALSFARKRGVLVVGASGNEGDRMLAFPAKSSSVVAVGATTEHGCLSDFSNLGRGLDLVAPGGGSDAATGDANCKPDATPGRPIVQLTFAGDSLRRFGYPTVYEGTSMAAPHVSAAAALVIASKVLGPEPTAEQVIARLRATARDLGPRGVDTRYGAGLLDAAAATDPGRTAGIRRAARR
jgi:serine protease